MDLYLQILELGLDARTWIDYIVEQTRDSLQHEPTGLELSDIAMGVQRLEEKVETMKKLLANYLTPPVTPGPRQYTTLEIARQTFLGDDGYPSDTLLGKYYAVGSLEDGYDIQFLTPELCERLRLDHPTWQVIELKK
ncbi:MAG: hypothetical protein AB1489_07140 [Acidobacteriota bacterium]